MTELRGQPRVFDLEGVVLQSENGETFAVPFFLFPENCQELLRSGYGGWLAAETKAEKASEEELAKQRQAELFLLARG